MPNIYTQLYFQFIFAVKGRKSLIPGHKREIVEKYITGTVKKHGHKLLAIYFMPDHCHLFVGLNPNQSLSDLTRIVKSNSSKWINEQSLLDSRFLWQEGFGVFSYSKSQKKEVVNFILNQPEYHNFKSFKEEFLGFLEKFEIEYNEKYLFDWIED